MPPQRDARLRLLEGKDDVDTGYTTLCWIWRGSKLKNRGYALISIYNRCYYGHRISYMEFVGSIPYGAVIDHLCRQPSCINPEHLEAVTQKTNVRRGKTMKRNGHLV